MVVFFVKFANYEAFKGVFLSFQSHFLAFQACSSSLRRIYRKIGLRLLEGVFLSVFLFPLFFPLLSFPLLSVFSVCVFLCLLVICVYDEEGREEYLWEIRQRGGGAAPSRPCYGAAPLP